MNKRAKILRRLDDLNISYSIVEHPAVFTIEAWDNLKIEPKGRMVKNLFLRDAKGKRHLLVVIDKDKKLNLKQLSQQLNSSALSFASERRLAQYLQLTKGAVTPLGIIHDEAAAVELVFDSALVGADMLGVHPNENTATLWITFNQLKYFIEQNGNVIHYIEI